MLITFQHQNKQHIVSNMRHGLLQDIVPPWFPANALMHVTFTSSGDQVHLEGHQRPLYMQDPSGKWQRITTESCSCALPVSISASSRGVCVVSFKQERTGKNIRNHSVTHDSMPKRKLQDYFTIDETHGMGDQYESFASVSSGIVSMKMPRQSNLYVSDLSVTLADSSAVRDPMLSKHFREHPSVILRRDPYATAYQQDHGSGQGPSVLDDSDLSITALQVKKDTLYILTTCEDTSGLEDTLYRLFGKEHGTEDAAKAHDPIKGVDLGIGRYIIVKRVFDLFVHLMYSWGVVLANRDTMICIVEGIELWLHPIIIFALLTNIPIYSIDDYVAVLHRYGELSSTDSAADDMGSDTLPPQFLGDLQQITLNSALVHTILPPREVLLNMHPNSFYASAYLSGKTALPRTFFLPEVETTVFASANELINMAAQATLQDIQAAIHRYIDWSLALTANRYNIWVRLLLNKSLYNRLSHEIDSIFRISHSLASPGLMDSNSIILCLDGPAAGGSNFTIQTLWELLLRGPHMHAPEDSTTEI